MPSGDVGSILKDTNRAWTALNSWNPFTYFCRESQKQRLGVEGGSVVCCQEKIKGSPHHVGSPVHTLNFLVTAKLCRLLLEKNMHCVLISALKAVGYLLHHLRFLVSTHRQSRSEWGWLCYKAVLQNQEAGKIASGTSCMPVPKTNIPLTHEPQTWSSEHQSWNHL